MNIANNTHSISIQSYLHDEIGINTNQNNDKFRLINNYINIMQLLSSKSIHNTLKIFNPSALYKKIYIQLDTRNAAHINDTKATWYLTTTKNVQSGFININQPIRDIIQLKMMNCYIYANLLCNNTHAPYTPPFTATLTNISNYSHKYITLFIEELNAQAFTLNSGIKFHTIGYTIRTVTNLTELIRVPKLIMESTMNTNTDDDSFYNGTFRFKQPVTLFDKITLSASNLKLYMPLESKIIELRVNVGLGTLNPFFVLTDCSLLDNRYPLNQYNLINNVTLPDITTSDPAFDAAWIAAMRAETCYMRYVSKYIQVYTTTIRTVPIGTVQNFTVRFSSDVKLITELEITYIDSVI